MKLFFWKKLSHEKKRYYHLFLAILLVILIPFGIYLYNGGEKAEVFDSEGRGPQAQTRRAAWPAPYRTVLGFNDNWRLV